MTIPKYFEQVKAAREVSDIPMVFMGYLNQVYRMGAEAFCQACKDAGIDAVIVPDLPMEVYQAELADLFAEYGLPICFLITPQTSEERIRKAAELSGAFCMWWPTTPSPAASRRFPTHSKPISNASKTWTCPESS